MLVIKADGTPVVIEIGTNLVGWRVKTILFDHKELLDYVHRVGADRLTSYLISLRGAIVGETLESKKTI